MSQPLSQSEHRLNQLRQLPLEPAEYCQRWVTAAPGKGYLKVAINAELCSEVVYGQRRKKGRILLDKQRPDEDTP